MAIGAAIVTAMNTTISVPRETRDLLARIAAEMHVPSMAEALKIILFEYESAQALARLQTDHPAEWAAYQVEGPAMADRAHTSTDDADWLWEGDE